MNSLERCMAVLEGGIPDRVPVVPQCFMFAMDTAGVRMRDAIRDARKMVEAQRVSLEKYGYDGCIIDFQRSDGSGRSGTGESRGSRCAGSDLGSRNHPKFGMRARSRYPAGKCPGDGGSGRAVPGGQAMCQCI